MTKLFTLFSSSAGNCTCLDTGDTVLLIDAGGSCKKIVTALGVHGISPEHLRGIVLTHEHTDHISALRVLLNRYNIPVYATAGTLAHLEREGLLPPQTVAYELLGENAIDDVSFTYFRTQHDASESCGYRFTLPNGHSVGFATDLGAFTESVAAALSGCEMVVLESNYDPSMLDVSGYPYPLIRRIKSEHGHLSNEDCADAAIRLGRSGVSRLLLAHTSKQNNLEELAYHTTQNALREAGIGVGDLLLEVAPKFAPSPVLTL